MKHPSWRSVHINTQASCVRDGLQPAPCVRLIAAACPFLQEWPCCDGCYEISHKGRTTAVMGPIQ